jgi:predicted nucleic acid-binding protein
VKYLVDTSALVRIWRKQVDPTWREAAGSGVIAVCEPVLAELLFSANSNQYVAVENETLANYPYVTVPDAVWDRVDEMRHELARRSAHRGPSIVDMIVASTAICEELTVLHDDRDFETVARFIPRLKQRRINTAFEQSVK